MGTTLWWYLAILFAPCLINAVLQDADHYRRWGRHLFTRKPYRWTPWD